MRSGTAAGVRSRGFTLAAAGKTGTSRDGWFVGFTSKLICAVWVGFDDNTELKLEGSKSALPIWTEFMKRAHQRREYRNVTDWDAPDGIVSVEVDPASGQLATASCPAARDEVFVSGSQPVELCRFHGGGLTHVAGWETAPAPAAPQVAQQRTPSAPMAAARDGAGNSESTRPGLRTENASAGPDSTTGSVKPSPRDIPKDKRGFFGRLKDIFR
jgi:penicillin-binding protein 1B